MAHPSRTFARMAKSSDGDVTIKSSIREAFETEASEEDKGQWTEVATEKKAASIPDQNVYVDEKMEFTLGEDPARTPTHYERQPVLKLAS